MGTVSINIGHVITIAGLIISSLVGGLGILWNYLKKKDKMITDELTKITQKQHEAMMEGNKILEGNNSALRENAKSNDELRDLIHQLVYKKRE